MAAASLYDLTQLDLSDEDVLMEIGGKNNWTALSSALESNVTYEFVSDEPIQYMDFTQRYLVTKVEHASSQRGLQNKKGANNRMNQQSKKLLAYCFQVNVQEGETDFDGGQIPSAIIEDIIADVELMKGQSAAFGEKFQVYSDVCISYYGLTMSSERTFEIASARKEQNSLQGLQVMLIHEQIPNLGIDDDVSETDPDWENKIEVNHLFEHTLSSKKQQLLEHKQLLPLIIKVLNMVSALRDQYFYEFEIQNHNLMVTASLSTQSSEADMTGTSSTPCDFMLVNQSIPFVYRHMVQTVLQELYGENEYEFNEVCLLKKVAAFLVTLAMNQDPGRESELLQVCQKWNEKLLINAPREKELQLLLDEAYNIVNSLSDKTNLMPLSKVINNIQAFIDQHHVKPAHSKAQVAPKINGTIPSKLVVSPIKQGKSSNRHSRNPSLEIENNSMQSNQKRSNLERRSSEQASSYQKSVSELVSDEEYMMVQANDLDKNTMQLEFIAGDHASGSLFFNAVESATNKSSMVFDLVHGSSGVPRTSLDRLSNGGIQQNYESQRIQQVHGQEALAPINEAQNQSSPSVSNNLIGNSQQQQRYVSARRANELNSDIDLEEGDDDSEMSSHSEQNKKVKMAQSEVIVKPKGYDFADSLLRSGPQPSKFQKPNKDIAEPNFSAHRENVRYQAMQLTQVIEDVDSSEVTSLVSLGKGYFATASASGTIKVWEPLNVSPIATITEENAGIDFLLPIVRQNDSYIVYVCQKKLKCFNVKTQRAMTLLENNVEITAICQNQQNTSVISLGLSNGVFKDYDLKKKRVIRTANLHQGSRVAAITSKGKFLVSVGADGKTIIYDYGKQEACRELDLQEIGIQKPSDLLVMEDENTLVVSDDRGLHPIDIAESASAEKATVLGEVHQLVKLHSRNLESRAIYAACCADGSVRLYKELQDSEETPRDGKYIIEDRRLGGGIKANSVANKGAARRIIQLPNGALVVSYQDRSVGIWEEKRKAKGAACGCCTIF